ncbi:MAG: hypothetical protein HON32_06020 [Francisellaceae bacterium]|jgi:hypothetical protein|nr:hypothetical protein [Francisellaceae bacterium]MBT6538460.1 hypothetical protein [Francisellaceae bacterium]
MNKIIGILLLAVLIAVGGAGFATHMIGNQIEHQIEVINNTSVGKYANFTHKGLEKKYSVKGVTIKLKSAEMQVPLGKIVGRENSPKFFADDEQLILIAPEIITFSNDFFSNEVIVDTSGESKFGIAIDERLVMPPLSYSTIKETYTFSFNLKKIAPWKKPESVFNIIDKLVIKSIGVEEKFNGKVMSTVDSINADLDWLVNKSERDYTVNVRFSADNFVQTPQVEKFNDFITNEVALFSGQKVSSIPLETIMRIFNVKENTENIVFDKTEVDMSVRVKNCSSLSDCKVNIELNDVIAGSNLSRIQIYNGKYDIVTKGSSDDIKVNDLDAKISLEKMNVSLSKSGYQYAINNVKKTLARDFLSEGLNPEFGYDNLYMAAQDTTGAISILTITAYFEKLFVPYDWVANFSTNYTLDFSIKKNESPYIIGDFYLEALEAESNKINNALSFTFNGVNNVNGEILMASPYDNFESFSSYYNKVISNFADAGMNEEMSWFTLFNDNFATAMSRVVAGVGEKDNNNMTVIKFARKLIETNNLEIPQINLGGKDLGGVFMELIQAISTNLEKPVTNNNADMFIKMLADKDLAIANYIYGARLFAKGELTPAVNYLTKAEEQGFTPVYSLLGYAHYSQFLKSHDSKYLNKALHYLKLSGNHKDFYGLNNLGVLYAVGNNKNMQDAEFYLNESVKGIVHDVDMISTPAEFNLKSVDMGVPLYVFLLNSTVGITIFDGNYTKAMINREVEAYVAFPELNKGSLIIDITGKYPNSLAEHARYVFTKAGFEVKLTVPITINSSVPITPSSSASTPNSPLITH